MAKWRHPNDYISKVTSGNAVQRLWNPTVNELPLEFMMNWLRLHEDFSQDQFVGQTGLPFRMVEAAIQQATAQGLLHVQAGRIGSTDKGRLYLNDLLAYFVPD